MGCGSSKNAEVRSREIEQAQLEDMSHRRRSDAHEQEHAEHGQHLGHQVVLQRELEEINCDLVQLQQMGLRYTAQNGISFAAAIDQLVLLRAEKEALLQQVSSQLAAMQSTIATSSQLVTQLLHQPSVAPPPPPLSSGLGPHALHASHAGNSASPSRSARWGTAPMTTIGSRSFASGAALEQTASFAGGVPNGVVHLSAPSGLMVTTNSTILSNSPARQRW